MKKAFSVLLLCLLITGLIAGCSAPAATEVSPGASGENGEDIQEGEIGVSLSEDSAFNSDFTAAFKKLAEDGGYKVVTKSAGGDYKKQNDDIVALIGAGVKIMVIDPVNIDELDTAIGECDTAGVPVINLMEPINDEVRMLISPDYKEMGGKAAEAAKAMLTNGDKTEGHVLMLQGSFDSFLMQMLHDGFLATLPKSDILTVDAPYCDFDQAKAYDAAKAALASAKAPSLIFAQSESMAKGAVKAIDEAKANVKIVTIGADAEILQAIGSKKIGSAVYTSPKELANKAFLYVQKYLKDNNAALPAYSGMTVAVADGENAASLLTEGSSYASLPDGGDTDVQESEEPAGTETSGTSAPPESSGSAGNTQPPASSEPAANTDSPAATDTAGE